MKRMIVNADDFGFSEAVNHGILKAMQEGIVTSTSIMANMRLCPCSSAVSRASGYGCGCSSESYLLSSAAIHTSNPGYGNRLFPQTG